MLKCVHRRRRAVIGCAVLAVSFPSLSSGATYYWDTASGTWSNGANWSANSVSGGPVGVVPGAADVATFNQSAVNGAETISLDGDVAALGAVFNNTGTTLIQGDGATPRTLTLGGNGIFVTAGAGGVTLGNATNVANVSLAASQAWSNNAATALTVVNGVSLANAGAQTLTVGGTGNTTLSGIVGNGAGTLGLAKAGTGTLVLGNAANAYDGGTAITGGTLSIAADTALGTVPGAATPNAITINNTSAAAQLATTATMTLAANRGIGLGSATAGSGGGINVAPATTLTYGGVIANNGGANSLLLTGTGTLQLTGANTYTGGTVIGPGGTLMLGNGTANGSLSTTGAVLNQGTLNVVTSATAQTIGSVIAGGGNVVVSGTAAGAVTIGGANTHTGSTSLGTINNSVIQAFVASNASAFGVSNNNARVTLNSGTAAGTGSTLTLASGIAITGKTLVMATGNAGQRLALFYGTNTGTGSWNGNIVTTGAGGAQFYSNTTGGVLQLGANATQTITGVASVSFRGSATGTNAITVNSTINLTGVGISHTETGPALLNSPYNVWNTTNISIGSLVLGANEALMPTAALSLGQGNSSSATLNLNGKTQTVTSLSDSNATGTSTTVITSAVTGGVFTLNNAAANSFGSAGTGGTITGAGFLSVAKMGAGTFTLNSKAANSYAGTTTVNAGTFNEDFVNLATPTNLINPGSALVLGGGTLQVTAKASAATSQTFAGLTVNAGGSAVTANNAVTGTPDTLIALGAITRGTTGGTVTFTLPGGTRSATNAITTTTANANGILGGWAAVGNDWATVDVDTTITNYTAYTGVAVGGGTVANDGTANVQFTGAAGGSVAPAAAGTTDVNTLQSIATGGTATYAATAASDVLRLGAAGGVMLASAAGPLTLGTAANNGVLTAGGAADAAGSISFWNNSASSALTVNLTIANNGAGAVTVNKAGTGSLVLNGTNTYTGGTSIGGGTVTLGNASALGPNTNPLTLTAGTLDLNGNSVGVGVLTGFGGTIQSNVAGAATLTIGNGNATAAATPYRGVIANGTGTVGLVKTGTGTLVLAGNNTYTGTTTVTGTLQVGADTNTGTLGTGAVTVNAASTLAFNRADATYTVANDIGGAGSVAFTGRGTVTLTSANNTYAGPTTISAGTLALSGGNNRLPATTTLAFNNTVSFASWLNLGTTNQTVAGMTFFAGSTAVTTAMSNTVTGTGTLTVNGTAADFVLGSSAAPASGSAIPGLVTLDMGGLSTFVYNSPTRNMRLAYAGGANNFGSLNRLADVTLAGTNTITANALAIGDVDQGGFSGTHTLRLGTTNTLNVGAIHVGNNFLATNGSSRSNAFLEFASGLTNPTVRIRNTDGTSPATTIYVGRFVGISNTALTSTVDLSAGTTDALVTNMIVGSADIQGAGGRFSTGTGTFVLGAGSLTATNLTVGLISSTTGSGSAGNTLNATGVFTLNNAAGTLNATTINLATNTITETTGANRVVTGTINLQNGTIKATTIQRGAQTGTATSVTTNFNWTTGTVQNTDSANLTITAVPITLLSGAPHTFHISGTQTGTLASTSPLGGVGGITKAGTGTLILAAANTYSGVTSIADGLALLNGNNAAATGLVSVLAGGTLGGSGTVGGATTVAGTIAPGAAASGSGTLNIAAALNFNPGGKYAFELSTAGGQTTSLGGSTPASPQTNHDQLAGTAAFDFANATINVSSLGSTGLDPNGTYSWLIATSTTGLTGTPTLGTIAGADFAPNANKFSLSTDGSNLYLNYAVPEPGSASLATAAAGLLLLRGRRGPRAAR